MERWEEIAKAFHEHYEAKAPEFGYRTREESAVPWDQVPEANRALMVATVKAAVGPVIADLVAERDEARAVLRDVHTERDFRVRCNDWIQGRVAKAVDEGGVE